MNDLTLIQFLAALPILFFGAAGLGALIWLIRRIRDDKGNNIF